jgi:hypothetical protein
VIPLLDRARAPLVQTGAGLLPGRGLVVLHRGGAANPVVFAMSTAANVGRTLTDLKRA